jgi:hypothetical protein
METLAAESFGTAVGSGLIVAAVTLLAGWLIGTQIADRWDEIKKRRELDLASIEEFYSAYGEMFAVQKIWDAYKRFPNPSTTDPSTTDPSTTDSDKIMRKMVDRAAAAEARLESFIVKLALERHLEPRDRDTLACFRQAYQTIRERIRDNKPIEWWATYRPGAEKGYIEYRAFKALAVHFACLLTQPKIRTVWLFIVVRVDRPSPKEAQDALLQVTAVGFRNNWAEAATTLLALPALEERQL